MTAKLPKSTCGAKTPAPLRDKIREHAANTIKVILLSGGLLGGLWLLQMVAKS
jgi:hypothetical protein